MSMTLSSRAKNAAITCGLYRPARVLHRALPSERAQHAAFTALYSQFMVEGDLVFDVGANIGSRTQAMLDIGAIVIAFEPQPTLAKELRARNNGNLIVIEAAVGATAGTANLHLSTSDSLASLVSGWGPTQSGSIPVPVTTLDAVIKQYGHPMFAKIDIEGYEPEALRGLSAGIWTMSIEYQKSRIDHVHECFRLLQQFGDFSVNLTGGEEADLLLPEWLPAAEFLKVFPDCTPYQHGDLFVSFSAEYRR